MWPQKRFECLERNTAHTLGTQSFHFLEPETLFLFPLPQTQGILTAQASFPKCSGPHRTSEALVPWRLGSICPNSCRWPEVKGDGLLQSAGLTGKAVVWDLRCRPVSGRGCGGQGALALPSWLACVAGAEKGERYSPYVFTVGEQLGYPTPGFLWSRRGCHTPATQEAP